MAARVRMGSASRRRPSNGLQPGLAAQYSDICSRCDNVIVLGERIVFTRGRAIHVHCASGQDDE